MSALLSDSSADKSFHVLHVVESFASGCLVALATLCNTLQDGLRHSIAYALRPETPEDFADLFPKNIQFYQLHLPRKISPAAEWRGYCDICTVLKNVHPEIVHCHSSKAGFWGRLAAKRHGIPSVYTPHGYAFLRTDINLCSKFLFREAERIAAHIGNRIVACGSEEYKLSCRLAGTEKKVVYIPNSVNITFLDSIARSASSSSSSSSSIRAGICGRLVAQKDPGLFSSIASQTENFVDWVWIGAENPAPLLPPCVECTGWISHSDALYRMANLDVYVQTSRWEGLSYAILEAMALGKPVVATDIPPNRSLVEHGVTGFLGNSSEELVQYITMLSDDAELRHSLGCRARRRIEEDYDAGNIYQLYYKLYHDLIKRA